MTRQEVKQLFSYLNRTYLLMAQLLYGSGLRLLECIRLRVKDIDFANNLLMIRSGKGEKDRTTVLPEKLKESLTLHLQRIKQIYDQDLENGYGETTLPDALEKKYPNANKEWAWQWVFPSKNLVVHPVDGRVKRHHIQPSTLQRISRSRKQRFTAHLAQARVLATLSTEFSASAFIQYNSAVDTAIANIRLRFNPREGNDLYLVYNEELNTDRSREIPRLPFSSGRTILIKYSYTFNY